MAVARRFAWLVILVLGVALFLLVGNTLVVTQNPNFVPSLILIGAVVVPAAFVAFLWGRQLSFGVSGTVLAVTALIGGVIGVVAAGLLEWDTLRGPRGPAYARRGVVRGVREADLSSAAAPAAGEAVVR